MNVAFSAENVGCDLVFRSIIWTYWQHIQNLHIKCASLCSALCLPWNSINGMRKTWISAVFLKSPQTNLSRTLMKTEAVFLQSELAMTTVGIKLLRPVAPQDYATSLYFENIIFRLYWFLHWRRKQVFWIKSSRALRPSQPTASFNHSSGLDNSHTSLAWFKAVSG